MSTSTASKRRPGTPASKPSAECRHREEIAIDEAATRITGELLAERKQPPLVPFDHLGQRIDHDQRSHAGILQHRLRGVAESEAAHHHVEFFARQRRQPQPRKFDLGHRVLARHQELVAELDLVDIDIRPAPSPPQAEHAHRRRAIIQLFEIEAHGRRPRSNGGAEHKITKTSPCKVELGVQIQSVHHI